MNTKWFVSTHPHSKVNGVVTLWSAVASHVRPDGTRKFVRTFPPQPTDTEAFEIAKNWILALSNTPAASA